MFLSELVSTSLQLQLNAFLMVYYIFEVTLCCEVCGFSVLVVIVHDPPYSK